MPRIQYPNVPNDAGVPQLLRRLPAAPPTVVATAAGLASLVRAFASQYQWGIFKHLEPTTEAQTTGDIPTVTVVAKRVPAVTPDSYLSFDYNQEWSVSTAPTQRGAFADYNRVASPFDVQLRLYKSGSLSERQAFLQQIEDLGTTQLYDVFTPEKTYIRCNFVRSEITRKGEKGAYQIMVDVFFREIRVVVPTYTKTVIANPVNVSASQQQNTGTQQGVATTATPPPSVTR
jgi:hypothetical protein